MIGTGAHGSGEADGFVALCTVAGATFVVRRPETQSSTKEKRSARPEMVFGGVLQFLSGGDSMTNPTKDPFRKTRWLAVSLLRDALLSSES